MQKYITVIKGLSQSWIFAVLINEISRFPKNFRIETLVHNLENFLDSWAGTLLELWCGKPFFAISAKELLAGRRLFSKFTVFNAKYLTDTENLQTISESDGALPIHWNNFSKQNLPFIYVLWVRVPMNS